MRLGGINLNTIFKNPEIKTFLSKLLLIHIIFTVLIMLFIHNEISTINKNIVNANTNIAGQILYKHPELEEDIIHTITKPATEEEIQTGKKVLKKYSYDENIKANNQPYLCGLVQSLQLKTLLLILVYLIPLVLLATFEYKKLYNKIKVLSKASEDVMNGDFKVIENNNNEGDFAILSCNFNSMSNRLRLSLEGLENDKIFLKNIISDISHQLKTPLSSLSAMNEIMLYDTNMSLIDKKSFIEKSHSQLNRMEWLIINLLKIARLESGSIQFKAISFPIIDSINAAVSCLSVMASKKQITIDSSSDDNICIRGDKEWTVEAFTNILKNSIEHTNQNGKITIQLSETGIYSSITIEDNGEGIDKKDIPHIFERFYKGTSTVKAESIVIGLSLSKIIIEAQNGTISVYSEKGKGAKFTITFLKFII